jgi:outer membrane biogenesis lipoprotein LolB
MKTIKHLLLAIISSLLLTAGLAKAAESFDVVGTSSQVQQVQDGPGAPLCVIPH